MKWQWKSYKYCKCHFLCDCRSWSWEEVPDDENGDNGEEKDQVEEEEEEELSLPDVNQRSDWPLFDHRFSRSIYRGWFTPSLIHNKGYPSLASLSETTNDRPIWQLIIGWLLGVSGTILIILQTASISYPFASCRSSGSDRPRGVVITCPGRSGCNASRSPCCSCGRSWWSSRYPCCLSSQLCASGCPSSPGRCIRRRCWAFPHGWFCAPFSAPGSESGHPSDQLPSSSGSNDGWDCLRKQPACSSGRSRCSCEWWRWSHLPQRWIRRREVRDRYYFIDCTDVVSDKTSMITGNWLIPWNIRDFRNTPIQYI